ncbi:NACHT and WD repeat domain-containing protein 2 [Portunus trituberculatus]|uniref:NACHT and WD repeat domain-containing protein 2 n=1 Tax=Portunus trituberculatus TaxID=210409 RepID=A0A5B7EA88_PORTR|nr:NACHT and WD repeat domain-containing protein 2 [Portunus trituberculatus]
MLVAPRYSVHLQAERTRGYLETFLVKGQVMGGARENIKKAGSSRDEQHKAKSVKEGRSCGPAFLDTLTLSQTPGFQEPTLVRLLQARPAIVLVQIKQQQQHPGMKHREDCQIVTEREVIKGILAVKNTKNHALALVRYINNINLQNLRRAANFIDIVNRQIDGEAMKLLSDLRDVRLPARIESTNYDRYTVEWIGREGLAKETHGEYLQQFCTDFYKGMTKLIDRAMRKEDSSAQGQIITEILQHLHACKNSVTVFYGREEEVKKVEHYIKGPSVNPLLLHGAGGCGKTSLLAKCASSCVEWLSHTKPILVIRFVGTSPESTALTPLLTSICHQVCA